MQITLYFMLYLYYMNTNNLNLNNTYYATLDENFNEALNLVNKEFTHTELLEMLKNGNIPQKQIAALRLDTITSKEDAQILLNNLTGQDGKIREVVSLRINEFMHRPELLEYFTDLDCEKIFLEAIIDINGNICRNIISAISQLKNSDKFCQNFLPSLIQKTKDIIEKVKAFDIQDGKYKINKEVFKLYWYLETIFTFYEKINFSDLKQILLAAKNVEDYTIREKVAKILTLNFQDSDLQHAKQELKNDSNYYVRRF